MLSQVDRSSNKLEPKINGHFEVIYCNGEFQICSSSVLSVMTHETPVEHPEGNPVKQGRQD